MPDPVPTPISEIFTASDPGEPLDDRIRKELEAQRRGNLHQELSALVDKYGIQEVSWMLGVVESDLKEFEVGDATHVSALLTSVGPQKIRVIQMLREIMGIGLKDAKDFVVGALPRTILMGLTVEQGNLAKAAFEEAGATIRLEPFHHPTEPNGH